MEGGIVPEEVVSDVVPAGEADDGLEVVDFNDVVATGGLSYGVVPGSVEEPITVGGGGLHEGFDPGIGTDGGPVALDEVVEGNGGLCRNQ